MIKRILGILALLVLLCGCEVREEAAVGEWTSPAATASAALENERLHVTFSGDTGQFSVTDKRNGVTYHSNPVDAENDGLAKGTVRFDLRSQITLEMLSPTGQVTTASSARECAEGGVYVTQGQNTVEVFYHFANSGFVIPLSYQLSADGAFHVSVRCGEILTLKENQLVSMTVLPYFGAGGMEEEGYLFVPDGSGALIRFNSEAYVYQSYSQHVYGRDATLSVLDNSETRQSIMLPVFGSSREDGGFTAIITQGAAQGRISAEIARKKTSYNTVYSGIVFTHSETERFMAGTANATDMRVYSPFMPPESYSVSYYFMEKGQNSFVDMANIYTGFLALEEKPDSEYGLHLDLYGALPVSKTFLGIPYTAAETLTGVDSLRRIALELRDMGVRSLDIRYLGWENGGLNTKMPNRVYAQEGETKLKALSQDLRAQRISLNLAVDFVNLYHGGNGFSTTFDVVRNISRAPAYQYAFMLSTGSRNTKEKPWNLLRLEKSTAALISFAKNARDAGFAGLSLSGNTNLVYSDYDQNGHTPDQAEKAQGAAMAEAAASIALQMDRPYGFALSASASVINTPVISSGFDVEWQSVPFYSIVLSGKLPCYAQPMNLRGDGRAYLLQCVAAGVMPSYTLIGSRSDALSDSPYSYLGSAEYTSWRDEIAAVYGELSEKLSQVAGKRIVGYAWVDRFVSITRYENGASVFVNRAEHDVQVEGVSVPAMDFVVVR